MSITGALDPEGRDLVLVRTIPVRAALIWQHLVDSDLLAAWFGTYTGDPASGSVDVTMTAEPGEATTSKHTIHACEAERLLTVSADAGGETWRLSLELAEAGEDATRIALRHHDVSREMVPAIGPGWEWYLDRLTGAVTGGEVPGMDVWDSEYMTLGPEYAAPVG